MRRALAAILALLSVPALAAIETTTITGTVYAPDGSVATGGSITCALTPTPGRASDGTNLQVVASRYVATISGSGTVSFTLVPNDVISPAGTVYACTYTITGPLRSTFTESWSVTTAPDPVSIGSIARVGGPTLTLPTISGASGTLQATDGSGGLTPVSTATYTAGTAATSVLALASGRQKIYCGYADLDANLDGHVEDRTMWDYDCDSTQEGSDWQTGIDNQCDTNNDNTQDGTAVDMDGDGTAGTYEMRCGTFRVASGVYVLASATDRVNLKWKGLTLLGSGKESTILKTGFTRAAYCATLPTGRTGIIQTSDLDGVISGAGTPGNSKGADWLEIGNMTIIGIGSRSATAAAGSVTGGVEDCNVDGTADDGVNGGGTQGEGLNNLNIKGLPGDTTADGTSAYNTWDSIEYAYIHDINMQDCDGACFFLDEANNAKVERVSARNSSEHCYAAHGNDQIWNDITGVNCGNKNWGGRGLEVFVGNVDTKRFTFTNFNLAGYIGIGIISANNSGGSPSAPAKVGDGILIANGHVAANDVKDTGSLDSGYCIQSNTASNMAGNIRNIQFENVSLDSCSGAAINWSQYDQDTKFSGLLVKNANYDRNGGYALALAGTRIQLVDSNIKLLDFDGNGTFENAAAVQANPCTRCEFKDNYVQGTLYHTGTVGGFFIENNSPEISVVNNTLDLNIGSALTNAVVGIFIKGGDDGNYVNNTVRLPAVTSKWGFYLNGTAERNRITSNRVLGGRVGYFEETGGQAVKTIGMLNYAAPSVTGDSGVRGFALGNATADSVWSFNSCMLPDVNGFCFDASGSNAVELFGNAAIAPLTGSGAQRLYTGSNVNVVEIAQPFNGTNNADTGIWVGGAALQGRAVCMSGANATDGFDSCFSTTNPTAGRTYTTPDASGYLPVSTRAAANGNQMVWSNKATACSTVCNNTYGPSAGCTNTIPDNAGPVGNCTDTTTGAAYHWCLCQ